MIITILLAMICIVIILGRTQKGPETKNPQEEFLKDLKNIRRWPDIKFWQKVILSRKNMRSDFEKICQMCTGSEENPNTELAGLIERIINILSINQSCYEYIVRERIWNNKEIVLPIVRALFSSNVFLSFVDMKILAISVHSLGDRVRNLGGSQADDERTKREISYMEKIQFQRIAADIISQKEEIEEIEKEFRESGVILEILKTAQ
ncbi:MAG: hypothetical protein WC449_02045 [Candidatus Paceibacterota bacterium]